ncbi:hypothetical protein [Bradyrhizobium sp. CCBAU 53421]|uniref:hypothetical protein n=1 Tax=Bradyrhizobium sp. CCBAU 53421 TaxID=1325120 RepID=UPI00188D7205|nr:hypothetical protein [Bradyrhizobium sp. CCBAU 53421]
MSGQGPSHRGGPWRAQGFAFSSFALDSALGEGVGTQFSKTSLPRLVNPQTGIDEGELSRIRSGIENIRRPADRGVTKPPA